MEAQAVQVFWVLNAKPFKFAEKDYVSKVVSCFFLFFSNKLGFSPPVFLSHLLSLYTSYLGLYWVVFMTSILVPTHIYEKLESIEDLQAQAVHFFSVLNPSSLQKKTMYPRLLFHVFFLFFSNKLGFSPVFLLHLL
jgi:hypothetical protein